MKYILFFFIFITAIQAKVINFSPLPIDKAPKLFIQYSQLLNYLEKETGYKFKFIYSSSYKELIKNFEEGKIDIVELGALPYVRMKEKFKDAYPFLTFNSKDGKPYYTCNLVTTEENINDFNDVNNKIDLILTRPLSTCGYLMSEHIMREHTLSLKDFKYQYVGTHSNVLLNLLLKENTIGTVKSPILDKYRQFKFKTLAKSPNIPGFSFIANKNTTSQEQINKIQKAILKLHPLENQEDKAKLSKWSLNTKYGAVKTNEKIYDAVLEALKNIQVPKENK